MERTPGTARCPPPPSAPPGTTSATSDVPAMSPGCASPAAAPARLTLGTKSVGDRQERNPWSRAKRWLLSALPVSPLMERSRREEGPGAAPVMEKPWGNPGSPSSAPAGHGEGGKSCLGRATIAGDSGEMWIPALPRPPALPGARGGSPREAPGAPGFWQRPQELRSHRNK